MAAVIPRISGPATTFPRAASWDWDSAGVVYVGTQWAGDPTTARYYLLPAWTRVGGAVYYRFTHRYDLALNIHNLLDKHYIQGAESANDLVPGEQRLTTLSFDAQFQ